MSMNRQYEKARAKWMRRYELYLNELLPYTTGKVCWDTAAFFFNEGLEPKAAAERHSITLQTTI